MFRDLLAPDHRSVATVPLAPWAAGIDLELPRSSTVGVIGIGSTGSVIAAHGLAPAIELLAFAAAEVTAAAPTGLIRPLDLGQLLVVVDSSDVHRTLTEIGQRLGAPFRSHDGHVLPVDVSIGHADADAAPTASEAVRRAFVAQQRASSSGPRVVAYDPDWDGGGPLPDSRTRVDGRSSHRSTPSPAPTSVLFEADRSGTLTRWPLGERNGDQRLVALLHESARSSFEQAMADRDVDLPVTYVQTTRLDGVEGNVQLFFHRTSSGGIEGMVVPARPLMAVLPASVGSRLSRRERDVAGLIAAGARVRDLCEWLFISEHTARNHLKNIFAKLSIGSQAELVALVAEHDAG